MQYLDSHIHLQDYKTQEVKNVVNNAIKNNVTGFINASSQPNDWETVQNLAGVYPQIIPAFGVHPWYINEAKADWCGNLEFYLQQNPRAIVGECGIDRIKNHDIQKQTKILLNHIALAKKYARPLIIHAVKANREFGDLFKILPAKTIFHSFNGSAEWGAEIQKNKFFIGLNFSVLRKKNCARLLQSLNLEKILLETDGPYQNNLQDGGETLPQNLLFLAQQIAELINIPLSEFLEILAANQQNFLGE